MDRGCVFLCDGDPEAREALRDALEARGRRAYGFASGALLVRALGERQDLRPDLVVWDVDGPGPEGLEGLRRLKAAWPAQAVVAVSAYPTVRAAVAALKLGALDYVPKPLGLEDLGALVDQVAERNRLVAENRSLKAEIRRRFDPDQVVYASDAFGRVIEMARRVAASDASVLIQGESGTGKELIASTIHYASRRREERFLSVNCAALTETLLESQLFGHVKGAFTGAVATQRGLVEDAEGGTLFLDEIGDVSPGLQAKLLRVLQEKEFLPVGSTRVRRADVRFVAATNKELEREVARGAFRQDLFYRLNVCTLTAPPLRDRPEDVEPLARFFLGRFGAKGQALTPGALAQLRGYRWPGNVRELENVMEMAAVLAGGDPIAPEHLPARTAEAPAPDAASPGRLLSLAELEAGHVAAVLGQVRYHKGNAARILGVSRTTLDRKIAEYGLARPEAEEP